MRIGILGGGNVARALGQLFAESGHTVLFGLRTLDAAGMGLPAAEPPGVAADSELFVLAVPYDALSEALPPLRGALAGKVVVDVTNPVAVDWSPLPLGDDNSAGEEVARLLPGARVVKAFNTVFADNMRPERLHRPGGRITCFVASDDAAAAEQVAGLATAVGFDPVVTGALRHARLVEAVAHLNIALLARNGMNTAAAVLYDRAAG